MDGLIAVTDPDAFGLEAARQVCQSPCVDKLAQDRRRSAAESANHVDQAEAVEAKTRHKLIMHEVLALLCEVRPLFKVAAD